MSDARHRCPHGLGTEPCYWCGESAALDIAALTARLDTVERELRGVRDEVAGLHEGREASARNSGPVVRFHFERANRAEQERDAARAERDAMAKVTKCARAVAARHAPCICDLCASLAALDASVRP